MSGSARMRRVYYRRKREKGLCPKCGSAAGPTSMCPYHAEQYRRYAREYRTRKRQAKEVKT